MNCRGCLKVLGNPSFETASFLFMPGITDIYNMCGIAGIISGNVQKVNQARLQKMTDALAHRGPDGEAQWINQRVTAGLAHRRLAIIDLSANAAQPMHYMGRYSIVHNGEIYNYIELRQQLVAKGYVFISQSDTEVILAAYACWKENCLQYFDGMFAFAIWDEIEQTLFAARDRFGEKPFYYCCNGNELLFASEMKALWAAGIGKQPNEKLLFNFITLGYTQNPTNPQETAYNNIHKLPAASCFHYTLNAPQAVRPVQYWHMESGQKDKSITIENAVDRFTALFTTSISNRLRSDVPLGTSLSGGLDSSSIAVMTQQLQTNGSRLQTFSAVFPGAAADESKYIQLLTAQKTIDNFITSPSASGFVQDFEKLCYYQEGGITSASVYAQFKVFELAKQHGVTVLLDGQGADEVLAGYHKYYHWYWQELYRNDTSLLRNEISAARQLGVTDSWNWKNKLSALYPSAAGRYTKNSRVQQQLTAADLDPAFVASYGISYYCLPQQDQLDNVLFYNTFSNGLEELLQYADRNSMAHGREVRLPFLQHQLVEFIFSLPSGFKIKSGRTKWILRKAMENLLPAEITWRKDKIGFEPPQLQWMQDPEVVAYIMAAKRKLAAAGILNKRAADKKIQPQGSHAADNFDWRYLAAAALL